MFLRPRPTRGPWRPGGQLSLIPEKGRAGSSQSHRGRKIGSTWLAHRQPRQTPAPAAAAAGASWGRPGSPPTQVRPDPTESRCPGPASACGLQGLAGTRGHWPVKGDQGTQNKAGEAGREVQGDWDVDSAHGQKGGSFRQLPAGGRGEVGRRAASGPGAGSTPRPVAQDPRAGL